MFPTDRTLFSITLWDDRDTDRPCSVVDVVPARWTPRVAFDDAILTLLSDFCSPTRGVGEWFDKNTQGTFLHTGFFHPDMDVYPGGVVMHTGHGLDGAVPLRMENGVLHLPSGVSLQAASFANTCSYTVGRARQYNRLLEAPFDGSESDLGKAAHAAVLGVFQSLVATHHPYTYYKGRGTDSVLDVIDVVADTLARALTCVPGSGQAASAKMAETMASYANALVSNWTVRPNRGWAAERWTTGEGWSKHVQAAEPIVLEAARCATNVLLGAHAGLGAIRNPKKAEGSAHLKLAATADRKAMDAAILRALATSLDKLKPQAAAKAQALAQL